MQTKEPQNLKGQTTQKEEVQTQKPQDLKGGGHEEKKPHIIQKQ